MTLRMMRTTIPEVNEDDENQHETGGPKEDFFAEDDVKLGYKYVDQIVALVVVVSSVSLILCQ